MHTSFVKILVLLLAFTLAIPESFAKRAGSGRSAGRQSTAIARPRPAPSPPVSRAQPAPPPQANPAQVQRAQPGMQPGTPPNAARQDLPPNAPEKTIPRQASSPWGGFLGGALLGLGLGSLLGDRDRDPNAANQSEGSSGTAGNAATGTGDTETAQAAGQAQQRGFGSVWWLGILALVVFLLVRRARRQASGR